MSTFQGNQKDVVRAEGIRSQYIERKATKLDELRKLDSKVKTPGAAVSSILGTAGALVMGAGMSNVMVWDNMRLGLTLGIPGMIAALLAYPVYKGITKNRKNKYADKIMRISNEIIGEA